MDFYGFDPAFRLVNGMIVDSLAVFDRLETESMNSLVTVSRERPAFYAYELNFCCSRYLLFEGTLTPAAPTYAGRPCADWCRNQRKRITGAMLTLYSDYSSLFKRRPFDSSIIILCVRPMLGFNRFGNAAITTSGIELAHKIKKGSSIFQDWE
jgi:hypothetical protein